MRLPWDDTEAPFYLAGNGGIEASFANIYVAVSLPFELSWDTKRDTDPTAGHRGIDASYVLLPAAPLPTKIDFYWATGPTFSDRLGGPVDTVTLTSQDITGVFHTLYGDDNATAPQPPAGDHLQLKAQWGAPPAGTKYLLAVMDKLDYLQDVVAPLKIHTLSQIFSNSLATPVINGPNIDAAFKPGGGQYTMSEAEVVAGVDHFNWLQYVTDAPLRWELIRQTSPTTGQFVDLPWLDPDDQVINANQMSIQDDNAGRRVAFGDLPVDDKVFYWDEPGEVRETTKGLVVTNSAQLLFHDAPEMPDDFLSQGDFWKFETNLMGVDINGNPMSLNGAPSFTWKSNTTFDHLDPNNPLSGNAFLKVSDSTGLPAVISGGVFDVGMSSSNVGNMTLDQAVTLIANGDFNNLGTVTIADTCTFTVSGIYTQSGPFGITQVDGTLTAGEVNINSGFLLGSGTVNGGLTVSSGAYLLPGDFGAGTLHSGNVTLNTGAQFLAAFNGSDSPGIDYSHLVSSGTVNLGGDQFGVGGATLNVALLYQPPGFGSLTLITAANPIVGTFNGLPEGATLYLDYNGISYPFTISYQNKQVVLTDPLPGQVPGDSGTHMAIVPSPVMPEESHFAQEAFGLLIAAERNHGQLRPVPAVIATPVSDLVAPVAIGRTMSVEHSWLRNGHVGGGPDAEEEFQLDPFEQLASSLAASKDQPLLFADVDAAFAQP